MPTLLNYMCENERYHNWGVTQPDAKYLTDQPLTGLRHFGSY